MDKINILKLLSNYSSHINIVLVLLVTGLFTHVADCATPADSCIGDKITSCACQTATGFINLALLDQAVLNGMPKFPNVKDPNSNDLFSYNPCTPYASGSGDCSKVPNVAACQTHGGMDYAIGTQDSAKFRSDSTLGTIIEYKATSQEDQGVRTAQIQLMCDENTEGTLLANGEATGSIFIFELTTKYACSSVAPAPPGFGGGGGGLSGGSILLIFFFTCLVVYLVSGLLYNKLRKGSSGMELIPNLEFWKMLPGLAKDGVLFLKDKIMGLKNPTEKASYESI